MSQVIVHVRRKADCSKPPIARSRVREATMEVNVPSEIAIERPRDEVSTYAANLDHAPAWYVNIKAVEWDSSSSAGERE